MEHETKGRVNAFLMGLVAAVASSLCCITPVLAAFVGMGSLAGTFHWLGPARPWLLGLSALALGYAWWLKLWPSPADTCGCEVPVKKYFLQRTGLLVAITAFAVLTSSFPFYASLLNSAEPSMASAGQADLQQVVINVKGMTCEGCEQHVSGALRKVPGVASAEASYNEATATVSYTPATTTVAQLMAAIDSTGYTALGPWPTKP